MFFKKYFIYFHTNSNINLAAIEMKYKKTMPTLPEINKEGYKFVGWYLDSECSLEYNLEKMPKNDVNLYAKWEAISLEEFLTDIDFFTKSANILKNLQNDYEGVVDFKDPKTDDNKEKKKKTTKKKTSTKKKTTNKKSNTKKSTTKKDSAKKVEEEENNNIVDTQENISNNEDALTGEE